MTKVPVISNILLDIFWSLINRLNILGNNYGHSSVTRGLLLYNVLGKGIGEDLPYC